MGSYNNRRQYNNRNNNWDNNWDNDWNNDWGCGRCPAGTMPYRVRSGDTFFSIARRYNTSVDALLRANPGVDPDMLRVGQIICVPCKPMG